MATQITPIDPEVQKLADSYDLLMTEEALVAMGTRVSAERTIARGRNAARARDAYTAALLAASDATRQGFLALQRG